MNTPNSSEEQPSATGSQVFAIGTLRDIFNLPTLSQMQTCLREMSEGMIQARIASDSIVEAMVAAGVTEITRAVEWPEVARWIDDGKGDVTTHFGGPDKVPVFTLHAKVDPTNDQGDVPRWKSEYDDLAADLKEALNWIADDHTDTDGMALIVGPLRAKHFPDNSEFSASDSDNPRN